MSLSNFIYFRLKRKYSRFLNNFKISLKLKDFGNKNFEIESYEHDKLTKIINYEYVHNFISKTQQNENIIKLRAILDFDYNNKYYNVDKREIWQKSKLLATHKYGINDYDLEEEANYLMQHHEIIFRMVYTGGYDPTKLYKLLEETSHNEDIFNFITLWHLHEEVREHGRHSYNGEENSPTRLQRLYEKVTQNKKENYNEL